MRQVSELLWLGNARDARTLVPLLDLEIQAVVDLAIEERPAELTREMIYFRIPLLDGAGNSTAQLKLAVDAVTRLLRQEIKLLVSCSAGLSRSPAIAAAALAQREGGSLRGALAKLAQTGIHDVSPGLLRDLEKAVEVAHD